mgnify:CR=1 FL=1
MRLFAQLRDQVLVLGLQLAELLLHICKGLFGLGLLLGKGLDHYLRAVSAAVKSV